MVAAMRQRHRREQIDTLEKAEHWGDGNPLEQPMGAGDFHRLRRSG